LLVPLLAGLLWSALPAARAAEEQPHAYVVIVGVSEYADKQIKPRKHAEDDAKALYDFFTNKDYVDTDPKNVKLLLGKKDEKRPSELATKENIVKAFHWAVSTAGKDDLVVFAFLGQGGSVGDRLCFFGSDADFKDRAKTAVTASSLEKEMKDIKSQRFCGLFDIYLKGFDAGKETVVEPNPNDISKIFLSNVDAEDPTPPPGRVIFLATSGLRPSLDLEKHGLFTHVVLDGLKGAADKEGYEPDGLVTVDELVEYMSKQLPAQAREHGKTREEKEQIHHVLGARANHFILTRNPTAATKVEQRLEKFTKLAKEKELSPEVTDEGKRLLSRMPKLKAMQELRKDYQKLADGELAVADFQKARESVLADMKLKRSDATTFATSVMAGINMLDRKYVKKLDKTEMVGWAVRGLYKRLEEKVPPDVKDRLDKVKELRDDELKGLLADVREQLGKREDLASPKDADIALQMVMTHLDPHTNYIDKATREEFEKSFGDYTGVGIKVGRDVNKDMLLVITPIKGSPAYRAGIKTGDIITTVIRDVDKEGKKLPKTESTTTKGMAVGDAVQIILGKAGTEVKLVIEREGVEKPIEFTLKRERIQTETVLGHKLKDNATDDWDFVIDPESRIAYIRLTQFNRNTFRDLKKALRTVKDEEGGIKGMVLDLRFNPGGLLQSAADICDLFIDDGLIVTIKPRVGKEYSFYGGDSRRDKEEEPLKANGDMSKFPMVVMVNGGSASASEIVSACLQDHGRAVVVGERSYGKGSVQNVEEFEPTGGQIKLTIASFWRPNGKNLDKRSTKGTDADEWGVTPNKDFLVKLSVKELDDLEEHFRNVDIIPRRDAPKKDAVVKPEFKDTQLEKALEYLRGQIKLAAKVAKKKGE
jgi:C-terminal peptidase prc